MNINAKNEIEQLKAKIEKMKARIEMINEREANAGFPRINDIYYFVSSTGNISRDLWENDNIDRCRASIGNVFRTKEEVEFAIERLKVLAEMRKYAFNPDWMNDEQLKYAISLDVFDNDIFEYRACRTNYGGLHFESTKQARECVYVIGSERLMKYYFCV